MLNIQSLKEILKNCYGYNEFNSHDVAVKLNVPNDQARRLMYKLQFAGFLDLERDDDEIIAKNKCN